MKCDHKNHNGDICQRPASHKCVNKVSDEPHYCCGLHSTMHSRLRNAIFKIDENGYAIPPQPAARATA